MLREFMRKGGHLVVTGTDATELGDAAGVTRFVECPVKAYFAGLKKNFSAASESMPADFVASIANESEIIVEAPITVATNITSMNKSTHIFLANFTGLVPHKVAVPSVVNVRVSSSSDTQQTLSFLPFLGEVRSIKGHREGNRTVFVLPALERGAVAWFDKPDSRQ